MNTKHHGQVRLLILKTSKSKNYIDICYEFAIVLENEDRAQLEKDLIEAAKEYVETVNRNGLPDSLLEKSKLLPDEYRLVFEELTSRIGESSKSPKTKLPKEFEQAIQAGRAQLAMASV